VAVSLSSGNERAGFAVAGLLSFGGLVAQWLLRDRIGRGIGADAAEEATTPAG
jgi:hypothetical protein